MESISSIDVLSNRADLVSGGDALVAVGVAARASTRTTVRVNLNGADITSTFGVRQDGSLAGLVTGLSVGENTLMAHGPDGQGRVITITNHPIGGPGLRRPAGDAVRLQPERVHSAARRGDRRAVQRADAGRLPLSQPDEPVRRLRPGQPAVAGVDPADDDDRGKTVPFIVQRVDGHGRPRHLPDRGARRPDQADRALVDRAAVEPQALLPLRRRVRTEHRQLAPGSVLQATQLGAGFAVATSSLNIFANNCNDVISAEAAMMAKEIVIERYGRAPYTMGNGGSAASMQQHLLAENYPGLLDGLTTSQVFEDHMDQVHGLARLPRAHALLLADEPAAQPGPRSAPPNPLFPTSASRQPVWGSNPTNPDNLCGQKVLAFGADRTELVPASNVACGLQTAQLWYPLDQSRAASAAGSSTSCGRSSVSVVTPDAPNGKGRSRDGQRRRPVRAQGAAGAGRSPPEQFVDLNAKVGGIDIDGNFTAERKAADPTALEIIVQHRAA